MTHKSLKLGQLQIIFSRSLLGEPLRIRVFHLVRTRPKLDTLNPIQLRGPATLHLSFGDDLASGTPGGDAPYIATTGTPEVGCEVDLRLQPTFLSLLDLKTSFL